MATTRSAKSRRMHPHSSRHAHTEIQTEQPRWNAVKHGLRSRILILPSENAAEFQQMRHGLFARYRPRTHEEAHCVELMAEHTWRKARCRRWQDAYDGMLDELVFGTPEGAAPPAHRQTHCEGDPHRWLHKATDCSQQETRLDRLHDRAYKRLQELQEVRSRRTIMGAEDPLLDWQELERAGCPAGDQGDQGDQGDRAGAAPSESSVAREPVRVSSQFGATVPCPVLPPANGSADKAIRNSDERIPLSQTHCAPPPSLPRNPDG